MEVLGSVGWEVVRSVWVSCFRERETRCWGEVSKEQLEK